MTELYCNGNRLTTLDLSRNTELTKIYCDDNPLTELNISNLSKIEEIVFGDNPEINVIANSQTVVSDEVRHYMDGKRKTP